MNDEKEDAEQTALRLQEQKSRFGVDCFRVDAKRIDLLKESFFAEERKVFC